MRDKDGIDQPIQHNVGRIGNLVLLTDDLNSEARIRPFPEKKNVYAKHHLRMLAELNGQTDWTLGSIEEREAKIVEWAKVRWADV